MKTKYKPPNSWTRFTIAEHKIRKHSIKPFFLHDLKAKCMNWNYTSKKIHRRDVQTVDWQHILIYSNILSPLN